MTREVSTVHNEEVIQLERPRLVHFFEQYIPLLMEEREYTRYGFKKRQEIRDRRDRTIRAIEREYDEVYDAYFVDGVAEHRQRVERIEQRLFKSRRFVFLKIWMLLWGLLFLFKETPSSTGYLWTAFFVTFPAYWFRGWIQSFFQFIFRLFKKQYLIFIDRMYIRRAAAKGITKDNLKEVGGFTARIQQARTQFNTIEGNVQRQNRQTLRNIRQKTQPYMDCIPTFHSYNDLPKLAIMYNAVFIGRADTWKECLEVLSIEEKHEEIVQNMQYLRNLGTSLVQESRIISSKLEDVNREIRQASDTLQSELQQVEYAVKYDNYATVDVYHHKSK